MTRAYSFLEGTGLEHLPNEHGLPVYLVRAKGQKQYERQPAISAEEAARKFRHYAEIKKGSIEVLSPGKDPLKDKPQVFPLKGKPRVLVR